MCRRNMFKWIDFRSVSATSLFLLLSCLTLESAVSEPAEVFLEEPKSKAELEVASSDALDLPEGTQAGAIAQSIEDYYDQVYQIRVISPEAGSKSSIGSGFQVSADGLIITNYHVVSSFVQSPDNHRIEYRSHSGSKGSLELLDFDVIHDLAILRHSAPSAHFLKFNTDVLVKGETVYALGNPRDYGTSLVKGPNNGMVEHSYNEQILFSGSLNPGMSGGPAVNAQGQVVGVNVATAGSQLSFLVPVNKAVNLTNTYRALTAGEYQAEIAQQIKQWQRPRIDGLLDNEWPSEVFAGNDFFGEIRKDFQCWGQTNDSDTDRDIASVSKSCRAGNSVYLDGALSAGELYFSFSHARSLSLSPLQFSSSIKPWMAANNSSNFDHSTNYRCHVDFLNEHDANNENSNSEYIRVTSCIRSFKKMPGLYDSLLLLEKISGLDKLVTHLSVSALEKDQVTAINNKFIRESL